MSFDPTLAIAHFPSTWCNLHITQSAHSAKSDVDKAPKGPGRPEEKRGKVFGTVPDKECLLE